MKKVDVKSLVIGALGTLLILSLTSGRLPEPESDLDVGYIGAGIGVYNKRTNTVYMYKGGVYTPLELKPKPYAVYQISENGSGIAEVTQK